MQQGPLAKCKLGTPHFMVSILTPPSANDDFLCELFLETFQYVKKKMLNLVERKYVGMDGNYCIVGRAARYWKKLTLRYLLFLPYILRHEVIFGKNMFLDKFYQSTCLLQLC